MANEEKTVERDPKYDVRPRLASKITKWERLLQPVGGKYEVDRKTEYGVPMEDEYIPKKKRSWSDMLDLDGMNELEIAEAIEKSYKERNGRPNPNGPEGYGDKKVVEPEGPEQ